MLADGCRFGWLSLAVLVLGGPGAATAAPPAAPSGTACAKAAMLQARKLLVFHFGSEDERMAIDDAVRALPSIANPANRTQRFDVLEVGATIDKGVYRMRFEYSRRGGSCLLMGQEILELADL